MSSISIEILTVEQLAGKLNDREFWLQNVAPVTRHRAQLLINNPRAGKDDPVLFIARNGHEVIGFRVVFPDRLYINDTIIKIGWGSSFWLDKRYRGKGIGRMLFEKGYELWEGNTGSLIQSDDAARVYLGSPDFYCLRKSLNYQLILRLNSLYWARKKSRVPGALAWIFPVIDAPVNLIMHLRQALWSSRHKALHGVQLEYCHEISDKETIDFIKANNHNTLARKEAEDLNVIVKYPTTIPTPLGDLIGSRYYFASKALRFDYLYVKVYDAQTELIGLMLMNIDGECIKLLYYLSRSEEVIPRLYDIFLQHAIKMKSEFISSYDEGLNKYIIEQSGFPILYKRKHVYRSFLSNKLKISNPEKYRIFDGDGA